jgi:hypothetical protein
MKGGKNPQLVESGSALEKAGLMAIHALGFLAQDEERVERFLRLTGVDPGDVRARLHEPAFQLAVLDHLAGDERLLLAFASAQSLSPAEIDNARRALGGGEM